MVTYLVWMFYFFSMLLLPFVVALYYLLLFLHAGLHFKSTKGAAPVMVPFILQCFIPVIGIPIFWVCIYFWKPFPEPAEWGNDYNGCIAFYIALILTFLAAGNTQVQIRRRKQRAYAG